MITVIIPTLNEASRIGGLLGVLTAELEAHEVIVVDGGSEDGTDRIAHGADVIVLHTAPGRGVQIATGAAAARGDVLLFLHADSRFPSGGLTAIAKALEQSPASVGGNFRLVFDGDDAFSAWLTGFYAWIRRRGLYYGDSGIFVRRPIYHEVGGVRPMALMEDYDFIQRLERSGQTCCIAEPPLVTSARKFKGRHPIAVVAGWLLIHFLYALGMAPSRLARLYYGNRPAPG